MLSNQISCETIKWVMIFSHDYLPTLQYNRIPFHSDNSFNNAIPANIGRHMKYESCDEGLKSKYWKEKQKKRRKERVFRCWDTECRVLNALRVGLELNKIKHGRLNDPYSVVKYVTSSTIWDQWITYIH